MNFFYNLNELLNILGYLTILYCNYVLNFILNNQLILNPFLINVSIIVSIIKMK